MRERPDPIRTLSVLCLGCSAFAAAAQGVEYLNVTAGGSLRPGIYGRIEMRATSAPPPVIYAQPLVANSAIERVQRRPVYLYVPPGQVRKWKQNCARWSACDEPVLFVRVDDSPSRWGQWRQRREQFAGQPREASH